MSQSLKDLVASHRASRLAARREMQQIEGEILDQLIPRFTSSVLRVMSSGSEKLTDNQRQIDLKMRKVREDWQRTSKELDRWVTLTSDLGRAVIELGDVKGWLGNMQEEINKVVAGLDRAQQARAEKPAE